MNTLKIHFQERFIYSWVISLIVGLFLCSIFSLLIWLSINGLRPFDGTNTLNDLWGTSQVLFWICLLAIGSYGLFFFSIGSILGLSLGATNQMILNAHGLWPDPKSLRKSESISMFIDMYDL